MQLHILRGACGVLILGHQHLWGVPIGLQLQGRYHVVVVHCMVLGNLVGCLLLKLLQIVVDLGLSCCECGADFIIGSAALPLGTIGVHW